MKRSRYTEEQMIEAVKQMEVRRPTRGVARELGVTDQALYTWRSRYSGMEASDARLLLVLEEENRRLWLLLRQEGRGANPKLADRPHREARLGVRLAVRRRLKRPAPAGLPLRAANEECALDLVSDAVASGGRIRILTVLDGYTRQCPGIEVGLSIRSRRVTRALERMIARWGAPKRLRSDNGPEFTSWHFLAWCERQGIEVVHIQPGRPMQNGYLESFNGRLRDKSLNANWFANLAEAKEKSRRG